MLVLEDTAPGGQAGSSSRIENYLGFPTGISGQELAGRALMQSEKFGAEVAIARGAAGLDCTSRPYKVHLATGDVVRTRTVVVASGARYRKPALPELSRFEGAGVMYSATHVEAQLCKAKEVAIVGSGNSAGQAAVFLSQSSACVNVLVRGSGLAESMSRYLIQRIEDAANVVLRARTEIEALEGTDRLERIRWRQLSSSSTGRCASCEAQSTCNPYASPALSRRDERTKHRDETAVTSRLCARVALASAIALMLGGCATANWPSPQSGGDGSASSASPSTARPSNFASPDDLLHRYPEMRGQGP